MPTCRRCSEEKSSDHFTSSQLSRGKWCRDCVRKQNRTHYRSNKGKINSQNQAYYKANREKMNLQAKERWKDKKDLYAPARQKWAEENREKMSRYYKRKVTDFRLFIGGLKKDIPCADCGIVHPPHVMEFDHVRGEKLRAISLMVNYRRERVVTEIAKCDLVCCACHRVRTQDRRPPPTTPKLIAYRKWLNPLKDAPCADCGRTLPPVAMDFDHLRDKVIGIADMSSWGRDKVLAELGKCELVCANCHRERTVRDLRKAS